MEKRKPHYDLKEIKAMIMDKDMICPACGESMRREIRDMAYTYKGEVLTVQRKQGAFSGEA